MRITDVIAKKRDGCELSTDEIDWFIERYTAGDIRDYHMAAWLMAVYIRGMNTRETTDLTLAMARSGDMLDLSDVVPFAVDKHSSGGVGDKVTLVVLPLVAACGVPVGKMSGRGLGFSGGTLDKMESIRGYRSDLTVEEFKAQLAKYGIVLSGQTADLAPADGKIYALRDVTATVSSLPLIASSIMSKKLAAGAQGIVLDVKAGSGAFMKTVESARDLAEIMVSIGRQAGRRMIAMISDMNQPLGHAVGNALEVREAIETLRNGGPDDLREHCLTIAGHMLELAGVGQGDAERRKLMESKLADGSAFEKFRLLVEVQGGEVEMVDDPDLLPSASLRQDVAAERDGYLAKVNALDIGMASVLLGAGREKKGDSVDHAVGVIVHHKVGDKVTVGEPLFTVHANDKDRLAAAVERLGSSIAWSDEPVEPLTLFYDTIRGN